MKIQLYKDGEPFNTIVATETFAEAYCAENNLTYTIIVEPEPELVEPMPTPDDDRDAMLVDLEYRVTLLELGILE